MTGLSVQILRKGIVSYWTGLKRKKKTKLQSLWYLSHLPDKVVHDLFNRSTEYQNYFCTCKNSHTIYTCRCHCNILKDSMI